MVLMVTGSWLMPNTHAPCVGVVDVGVMDSVRVAIESVRVVREVQGKCG